MDILTEEQLTQVLAHYPRDVHDLLIKQISSVSALILNNQDKYLNDEGFRNAMDLMLSSVIGGRFMPLGVEPK